MDTHSVYMPGSEGPFRCDHCEYYPEANRCNNDVIKGYAKQGRFGLTLSSDGLACVDPGGCSDEFKRKDESFSSELRSRNKLSSFEKD